MLGWRCDDCFFFQLHVLISMIPFFALHQVDSTCPAGSVFDYFLLLFTYAEPAS
jgi:hypothetical protein